MDLLIGNGRIIDPLNRIDTVSDILISDGLIKNTGKSIPIDTPDCSLFDATNMIVCPGFIDLHCHLREPGYEEKETVATGTSAAAAGGFTTVCCMPNTNPPIATEFVVKQIMAIAANQSKIRLLTIGSVSQNREGQKLADLVAMNKAGAVAFSDDGSPIQDKELMRHSLEISKTLNVPIIDHCEDTSLSLDGSMNSGALADKLGIKGIPAAAEELMVERDIALARETGGWVHIAHVSTAKSVSIIRQAKKAGIRITSEVTPHHLTLTEETVITKGTSAKVNPPLRTESDRKALVKGLLDGTIDAIVTDHAPHTDKEKDCDFETAPFGISVFETALGSLLNLVNKSEIDLITVISKLSCEPARILSNSTIGNLSMGSVADITIFDPNLNWIVRPELFLSKGKNTPLTGMTLEGKIMATFTRGKQIYNYCKA